MKLQEKQAEEELQI